MLNGTHRQPVPGPLCASYAPALPVLDDLTDIRLAEDTRAHLAGCAWCRAQRATYDHFDEALRLHFAPDAMPFLSTTRHGACYVRYTRQHVDGDLCRWRC